MSKMIEGTIRSLPPANEVCGKVVFSQVSVCPQGCNSGHMSFPGVGVSGTRFPSGGGYVQGVRGGYVQKLVLPLRQTWHTMGYGQQAGGKHPTEMLSCSKSCLLLTYSFPTVKALITHSTVVYNFPLVWDFYQSYTI